MLNINTSKGISIHASNIRDIIRNPKYKGWYYCANKVETIDFRTKKEKLIQKKRELCIEIMKMFHKLLMQNFGNGQKKKLMLEVKNILDNKDSIFEKICSLLNKQVIGLIIRKKNLK